MSSSRLPGKVLKEIRGKPALEMMLERVNKCKHISKLVIATSVEEDDNELEEFCKKVGVECCRGSRDNVLERFRNAANVNNLRPEDVVVRLTGDCPLHDSDIIDSCIELFMSKDCDLAGSHQPVDSFPDGQQVEVFTMRALTTAKDEATKVIDIEHVTPFINMQPDRFAIEAFVCEPNKKHLRWTLDEPEDYEFIKVIFDELYPGNPDFKTADIDALLGRKPELLKINHHHVTDAGALEGLIKSGAKDGLEVEITDASTSA